MEMYSREPALPRTHHGSRKAEHGDEAKVSLSREGQSQSRPCRCGHSDGGQCSMADAARRVFLC